MTQSKALADTAKRLTSKEGIVAKVRAAKDKERQKQSERSQGTPHMSESTWSVNYDYGPHMSNEIKVVAKSEDDARNKAPSIASKKHGHHNIMINHTKIIKESISAKKDEWIVSHRSDPGKEPVETFATGHTIDDAHKDAQSRHSAFKGVPKNKLVFQRGGKVVEEVELEEGLGDTIKKGVKNIKRGLQGWDKNEVGPNGEKLGEPRAVVNRVKTRTDDEIKSIHSTLTDPKNKFVTRNTPFDNPTPHSPAGLQKRVIYREMKKRGLTKEDVELDESFTDAQIAKLKSSYAGISTIDPDSDGYRKLTALLDKQDVATLKKLADAKIKFVSGLSLNRYNRKKPKNEGVELDDSQITEVDLKTLQSYANKKSQQVTALKHKAVLDKISAVRNKSKAAKEKADASNSAHDAEKSKLHQAYAKIDQKRPAKKLDISGSSNHISADYKQSSGGKRNMSDSVEVESDNELNESGHTKD